MILATAPLLQADAVFPQRDLLLDSDYVAELLSRSLGCNRQIRIQNCERVRVTYRPGQSLRVIYKFCADGQPGMIAARAFAPGRQRKSELTPNSSNGEWHSRFWDEEGSTCFWTFPHDRKIANLPALMQVPPAWSELLDSQWVRSRLVAYASEKCATVQCLDNEQKVLAYAKIYAGNEGLAAYNAYNALSGSEPCSERGFRAPRPILYSTSAQLLIVEAIEGRRIADLQGKELEQALYSMGQALAGLHSSPMPSGLPEFTRFRAEHLQEAADVIAMVRPDEANCAEEICEGLCSTATTSTEPEVCLHGDVHLKNGILRNASIVLIDLDQVARGPAAADIGSLLAALRYETATGNLSHSRGRELAAAFLAGYSCVKQLPSRSVLRWHTAAALLGERALRAVVRVREEGLRRLSEILLEAKYMLEEARD